MSHGANFSRVSDHKSEARKERPVVRSPVADFYTSSKKHSSHESRQRITLPSGTTTPRYAWDRCAASGPWLGHRAYSDSRALSQQDKASPSRPSTPRLVREPRWNRWELSPDRPSSAAGRAHANGTPTRPQRLLRTSTSIPDYKAINAAYDVTAAATGAQKAKNFNQTEASNWMSPAHDDPLNAVRESLRSALTVGSSVTDHSTTERSASWTDQSSISDVSTPPVTWPRVQDDEMTVEDAIAMYSEGFADEPSSIAESRNGAKVYASSPLAHPYDKLSVPCNDYFSDFPPPEVISRASGRARAPVTVAQTDTGAAAHMTLGHDLGLPHLQDRLKALIGPPRDRYGFKKESFYVKAKQYDTWNAGYTKYLGRRRKKWEDLLKHHNLPTENPECFPPRSDKVKRYVRKGIPPEWRGAAWFYYAGGPARIANDPGLYERLVNMAAKGGVTPTDKDHIERDLFRTFPDHIKFKSDSSPKASSTPSKRSDGQVETPMIMALRRVLQAFAIHNPRIGYCQSLNFLAGFLLLFLNGSEEKTFHLLCIMTSQYLPGTHGISLEGANIDVGVLMVCLKESMPSLWVDKIDDRADTTVSLAAGDMRVSTGLPTVSLATTGWFMSCFASILPIETTCRVWDCLFYEGSKTLFRVALAIFKLSEQQIRLTGEEPMEVFQVIQTLPKGLLDANLVMDTATKKTTAWTFGATGGFGNLSQKTVERRREERRKMYKEERERVLLKA